ncbi:MAG: outer membrane protein transport protein [Rhodospirillales bacterium]|nr:outer membrane protein transport protein [Rhodospirillales bacterium]
MLQRNIGMSVAVVGFGIIAIASLATGPACAAGFAIREQSATALGNAFAGSTAGAEDITYSYFNPAAMARQPDSAVAVVGSYIMPRSEFTGSASSTVTGTPTGGGDGGDDIAVDALVPATFAMWAVQPSLRLGLAVNVPFGLETDYDDGWRGRYHALRSRLRTVTATPMVSYQVSDMIALGAGMQIQYIDAKLSNAVDFGTIGALSGIPGAVPAAQDGSAEVNGDDVAVGFNLGVLVEPWEGTRFGAAFRSKIDHELEGDADFRFDSAGVGAALSGATGLFVDTGAKASVTTPEMVSFGVHQDIDARWSVMAEAAWTRWSRFEELRIRFDNPAQPDNFTEQDWDDSWFFAAGVTFRPDNRWALRAGLAYDQTPIPDDRRTPRIPASSRTWLSVGASFQPLDSLQVGIGYTHLFVDDGSIDLAAGDPGNTFRGNLSGESENAVDIFTLQLSWAF